MFCPLRPITGVDVADLLANITMSPAAGDAGKSKVNVAVNTYVRERTAVVLVLMT